MNSNLRDEQQVSPHNLVLNLVHTPQGGRIGLMRCPGATGYLQEDMQWLSGRGDHILSLITSPELDAMQLQQLGAVAGLAGMQWQHLPVFDMCAPDPTFMQAWPPLRQQYLDALQQGQTVLMHCRAGLGRAGTLAAHLLTHCGLLPQDAITTVRHARPGAIETMAQAQWIHANAG